MKKVFSNILFYGFLALVLIVPLVIAFQEVFDVILKIGRGSIIAGIIITPFAVIGVINLFRGIGELLETDGAKFHFRGLKTWKARIWFFATISGYIAAFYVMMEVI